jgi:hypothetical protein
MMRYFALLCCVLLPSVATCQAPDLPPRVGQSETIVLFNGKDLEDWAGHKDKLWSVRDGILVGRNDDSLLVSTYLISRRRFTDFALAFSVRLVRSPQMAGVAFWGNVVPNRGDSFTYKGYLLQVTPPWGIYETFGRGSLTANSQVARAAWRANDWNDWEIFAQGNRIRAVLNGTLILDWRETEPTRIKEGPIALQLRAQELPQEIHYRSLTVTTFPDDSRLNGKKVGDGIPPRETPK